MIFRCHVSFRECKYNFLGSSHLKIRPRQTVAQVCWNFPPPAFGLTKTELPISLKVLGASSHLVRAWKPWLRQSPRYRVVPLANGRTSWLIHGGDPNHLHPSWDDPPSNHPPRGVEDSTLLYEGNKAGHVWRHLVVVAMARTATSLLNTNLSTKGPDQIKEFIGIITLKVHGTCNYPHQKHGFNGVLLGETNGL